MTRPEQIEKPSELSGTGTDASNTDRGFTGKAVAMLSAVGGIGAALTVFLVVNSSISDASTTPLAQEIGTAIEEWSVIHPEKNIPATGKFVSYPSYLETLDPDEKFEPLASHNENPEGMMVKVIKDSSESSVGFTVCAYTETGFTEEAKKRSFNTLHAFNSVTGEVVANDLATCS